MLKQKRVAVCFSGQLRDWQFAKKNILNFFSPPNVEKATVDYFIHTWDTNTWREPKQDISIFKDNLHTDFPKIIEVYKPKKYHMSVYNPTDWPLIWDPLFYSFEYSMLLKQQYELENNFIYDTVIKARPDVVYNPKELFPFNHTMLSGICYTSTFMSRFPREFNKHCFDDIIFFGDSKTMDTMSGLYKYYALKNGHRKPAETSEPPIDINTDLYLGPGTLLYQYAVAHNIHPETLHVDYAVIRSTMQDKGLDSVDDFDEIKKLWFEWYR